MRQVGPHRFHAPVHRQAGQGSYEVAAQYGSEAQSLGRERHLRGRYAVANLRNPHNLQGLMPSERDPPLWTRPSTSL